MAGSKKLTRYVNVGGVVYGPGEDLPADIAEQITNPKAFEEVPDPEAAAAGDAEAEAKAPAKRTAAKE